MQSVAWSTLSDQPARNKVLLTVSEWQERVHQRDSTRLKWFGRVQEGGQWIHWKKDANVGAGRQEDEKDDQIVKGRAKRFMDEVEELA